MKKVVYVLLTVFLVSSLSFAELKLRLSNEITGETQKSFINNDLKSNLRLQLPENVTAPSGEFLKMWLVGIMADATFPMGDFGDAWSTAFSGHVMIGYMIARSILINLSVGYIKFTEKESIEGEDYSYSWIPILLGVNYIFNPGQRFMPFIGAALGLYLISFSSPSITILGQTFGGDDTSTEFGIVPKLGALYLASAAVLISLALEYNLLFTSGSSTSALGVLFGVMFAFH